MKRREFISTTGAAIAGGLIIPSAQAFGMGRKGKNKKLKLALVGTGIRGITFWGRRIVQEYSDITEFVGLCDSNPGRLALGREYIGVTCPVFTDFDEMMKKAKPDMLMVCTVDSTHDEFVVKGLEYGANVLTEKPMTTDEKKCKRILDAEKKSGKKVLVGFNYRYNPHYTRIKELLVNDRIGRVTSVDFNWYLNVYHGASYFRRWHGLREFGGTLLVHKASHHFDLLNWWIDSDPVEVMAYGALEHYGKNNAFRGDNCRSCPHKEKCKFFWDITKDSNMMQLYVANEKYDGYIRDNCVFREEIDIYDKMAVQIRYANDVQVSYSLTTYSPYEGMRIAFNGFDGRLDAWDGIPWRMNEKLDQARLHAREMEQTDEEASDYEEIMVMDNFSEEAQLIKVARERGGHGGGDQRLQDKIFRDPDMPDPLKHSAGSRDGAFSVLIGVAARTSIETGKPVKIADLTDLVPKARREA